MLIYSLSVAMFYFKSWQYPSLGECLEFCIPIFFALPFIASVSFWFIVLYVPIALASKTQAVFEQIRRNWWIILLILALAVWHISFRLADINRLLKNFDSIALGLFSNIFFYPAMIILLSWLLWLVLTFFPWPRPSLSTMLIYSIAVANASSALWVDALASRRHSPDSFSLSWFLSELIPWFIALYVFLKLTMRIERQAAN
jgi:hypothetical protein